MISLFISYSRDDSLVMGILRDNLRKLGFDLWIDIEYIEPGTPQWVRDVKAALRHVDGMIVLCSPSAEISEWVNREVTIAKLASTPIFPVLIHGEVLDAMPSELIGTQYVDMRGRHEPEQGFRQLVATLAKRYGMNIPEYQFESGGVFGIPPIQIVQVTGYVEGSVIAISGNVAVGGDFVVGDQHIWTHNSQRATSHDPILNILPSPFEWCEIPVHINLWKTELTAQVRIVDQILPLMNYSIARFPITYEQFGVFLRDPGGWENKIWWQGLGANVDHVLSAEEQEFTHAANLPRENVSWFDAIAFCRWLSIRVGYPIRLPTEWEWQWAAQGPDGRSYPWGSEYIRGRANIDDGGTSAQDRPQLGTTPVDFYAEGKSCYGVVDMSGNVWEWCLNSLSHPLSVDLGGNSERALRGGSWLDQADRARVHYRLGSNPMNREVNIGFRIVKQPDGVMTQS